MSPVRVHTLKTDDVASANLLMGLAERYALEATLWKHPETKSTLERGARVLGEIARHTLRGNVDLDVADAYADAGELLLRRTQADRRLIATINTPPASEGTAHEPR